MFIIHVIIINWNSTMAILMVAKQHHYASLTINQQNLEKILGRTKFNMSSIHYHYPCSSFKSPTHKQQYQTKIMAMKYHHEASLINSNTQHGKRKDSKAYLAVKKNGCRAFSFLLSIFNRVGICRMLSFWCCRMLVDVGKVFDHPRPKRLSPIF